MSHSAVVCGFLIFGTLVIFPSETVSTKELTCQPGRYLDAQLCRPCPLGTYKVQVGTQSCQQCPPDAEGSMATTLLTASTNEMDCIFVQVITHFSPLAGPVSGGTAIIAHVKYLDNMDIFNASIAGSHCTNVTKDVLRSTMRCLTSNVSTTLQGPLRLNFRDGVVSESSLNFTYVDDPIISSIDRVKSIISGGISITVRGERFLAVAEPLMLVTRVLKTRATLFTVDCAVKSDSIFSCNTPDLKLTEDFPDSTPSPTPGNTTANDTNGLQMTSSAEGFRSRRSLPDGPLYNDHDTQFYLGFRLDGVKAYENMTLVMPQYGQMLVYGDPVYYTFREREKILSYTSGSAELIHILGMNLNYACNREDVTVMVGERECNITLLASNQLTCLPPASVKNSTLAPVTVFVGSLRFDVGYLDYIKPRQNQTMILAVVLGLMAVFFVIAAVSIACYRWRKWRKEKESLHVVGQNLEIRREANSSYYVRNFPPHTDNGYLVPVDHNCTEDCEHTRPQGDRRTLSSLVSVVDELGPPQTYTDRPSSSESYFENGQFFSKSGHDCDLISEISLNPELVSLVDKYRIDGDRLLLGDTIGQGYFGKVYKGELSDVASGDKEIVAVKTVTGQHCTSKDLASFLEEALIMKDFKHENVLSLIGVVIKFHRPHVVLPYMAHGDLRSYVKDASKVLAVRDLIGFAVQVANGMVYLSHLKFVHRDLAARNCMVDDTLKTKIADFGLSRDIYKSEYYRVETKHRPLPVRWMALESLTTGVFSAKSDVWSYGVVVWELLTRGCLPYTDVDSFNIRNCIQSGRRMPQPRHAPDEIYQLLLRCWDANTAQRPSFKYLHDTLHRLLQNRTSQNTAEYFQVVDM